MAATRSATLRKARSALRAWAAPVGDADRPGPGPLAVVVWVLTMTVLQVMRQHGRPLYDTIWAEDAGIFLAQALASPFPDNLLDAHASYVQLAPRLVTEAAATLPLEYAAAVISFGSALVVALLSVYVYFASSAVFRSRWAPALLAALMMLAPATTYETTATAANLHWYLLFTCFWALLVPVRSWVWAVAGAVIALVATLSDPLAGLLLPLALLQVVRSDGWRERMVPTVFAVGLAVQVVLGPLRSPTAPFGEVNAGDLPGIYASRVAGSFLVGDRFLEQLWARLGWAFPWLSLAVVLLVVGYGIASGESRRRFHIGVSFLYSVAFLAVPLLLRGTVGLLDPEHFTLNGSRYTLVPILLLAVAVLLTLDDPGPWLPRAATQDLQTSFVVWTLALVLLNYSAGSVRTNGPSWREGLAEARTDCAARPDDGGDAEVTIPLNPGEIFDLRTTCRQIR